MAQSSTPNLESFGALDWDAEYEEMATDGQSIREAAALEADEATDAAAPDAESSERDDDLSQYGDETPAMAAGIAEANDMPSPDQDDSWDHPGWTWHESPSPCPWTATSPEVSAWALSPKILNDSDEIINASHCGRDDGSTNDDIPRVASILRRAFWHAYPVPADDGVLFPALARGAKVVPRRGSREPREGGPKMGAKGLRQRWEEGEYPVLYVPLGETTMLRLNCYLPQPSHLSHVWNMEEMEGEEDEGKKAALAESSEEKEKEKEEEEDDEEEEWEGFESSSDDSEKEEGTTPATASIESLPEQVVCSTPNTVTKPSPLRPQALVASSDDSEDNSGNSNVNSGEDSHDINNSSDEKETFSATDIVNEDELTHTSPTHPTHILEEGEIPLTSSNPTATNNDHEIPPISSHTTTITTPSPCKPVRLSDIILQNASLSLELADLGTTLDMAPGDTNPLPSPVLLFPALALLDTNEGQELASPKTLYQLFVEQHDTMATGHSDTAKTSKGSWVNAAAAAVAVVGGMAALFG